MGSGGRRLRRATKRPTIDDYVNKALDEYASDGYGGGWHG